MTIKQVVIEPLGLLTQPNEYGQAPPGAMDRATNVHLRDPGIVSSIPGLQTHRSNALANGYTARRVWSGDSYALFIGNSGSTWSVKWVDASSSSAITSPSAFSHSFSTGIIPVARQRSRVIVGTDNGPIALDSETDSSARIAGLTVPYLAGGLPGSGSVLATGYCVAYTAIVRRLFSDGYELISPASNRLMIENTTGVAQNVSLGVTLQTSHGYAAGDLVEFYRTTVQPNGTDPGSTYYLASTVTVTSADVTAGIATTIDATAEANLGVELYTNPGQLGPLKSKMAPPLARDICVHEGHTFYFATTTPARLTGFVASTISNDETDLAAGSTTRSAGLGKRAFSGSVTSGSPTITGISAGDIVGLAVGQWLMDTGTGFASGAFVTAVGANSITLDTNSTSTSGPNTYRTVDVMTVDGYRRVAVDSVQLSESLGYPASGDLSFYPFVSASSSVFSFDTDIGTAIDVPLSGFTFTISRLSAYEGSFTIQASNGANYQPPIATYSASAQTVATDQKLNRVHWAESEQPEAVPLLNTFFVGSGEIYRGVSVGGVILVFASDGLWQISGNAQNGWITALRDPSLILASRGACAVMDGLVWAYTNRGLVSVTPDGTVTEHSSGRIGEPQSSNEFAGANFSNTWATFMVCDEYHHDVWVTTNTGDSFFVYHTRSGKFSKYTPADDATAAAYSKSLNSVLLGTATSGGPSLEYFRADSSATRHASAEARFLPLYFGDPVTLKEWIDMELVFDGVTQGAGTLVPSFGGTNYTARTVGQNATQSRVRVAIPRLAPAISAELRPGFTFSSGGTTNPWSLRALAVTYATAGEEGKR